MNSRSLRVYLLFANIIEKHFLNEFSIQKFKEAEFSLEPTIHGQSSLFAVLQILSKSAFK